jgi:16S rRNA (guanine527-N7)-methyltransferase
VFHVKHPEETQHLPVRVEARITELGEQYRLSAGQRSSLGAILLMLSSAEHAPTTVKEPLEAVDIHLADALSGLAIEEIQNAATIADIGAGAGFPGLPLAVALPLARFGLIESQARKCEFIKALCGEVGVENADVLNTRVEDWVGGIGRNDVVVARAIAPQPVVLEYAAPLLRLGGSLVDWRGRRSLEEEEVSLAVAAKLGLELMRVVHTEPYAAARDHHLHVFRKCAETPPQFPRRAGIARKRPLGP